MSVDVIGDKPQYPRTSTAEQEKIREFCYELALALRRITGKVVENDLGFLEEGENLLPDSQSGTISDKKSDI